jgi:2-C-methyl-D-erythritol 4-phosphate cytidylyltransferase
VKHYAIIVAGGSGSRMNADLPKQFLLLNGRPILMHTIEAFHNSDLKPEIILVLSQQSRPLWSELCIEHKFDIPCNLVENGLERFHSVRNGLEFTTNDSITAVHDAVRPIISNELITRCFALAEKHAAVIPAVNSKDSVRIKEADGTKSIKRQDVLLVQTPQVFETKVLKKAYQQEYTETFTDDASVVEKAGTEIFITEGDSKNIKITYPEDLQIAEVFQKKA